MEIGHFAAFGAYFLIILIIGIFSHRAQNTSKDFNIGNRSLSFWVTAFSAHASDMSGWLFMAFPAAIFTGGLPQAWIGLGLLLGMFLNWQLVSKRLRVETEQNNSYTLSTFFENKFHDRSGALRILTAIMAVTFLTFYLSAGLVIMGTLLESVFNINYYFGLSIAMLVVMTYTFIGGYYTIAQVDFFQAIFLMLMIIFVPVVIFFQMNNPIQTILDVSKSHNISLSLFGNFDLKTSINTFFLLSSWGLGYFGQPHIITKFMGIHNPNDLKKSKYVGMAWQFTTLTAAVCIGILGIGYYNAQLANPELVFVDMVQGLFNPLIAGFILCGVLAANMSTMDSQILVCSSILSEDLYKFIVKKHATPRELLLVSRIGVILVSLFSLSIAFYRSGTILDAVLYAWSGLGSSFGPLILMSLYFKRCNKYGAIAGILVGGITAGLWTTFIKPHQFPIIIPAMVPGFALSLISIFVVSLLTQKEVKTA